LHGFPGAVGAKGHPTIQIGVKVTTGLETVQCLWDYAAASTGHLSSRLLPYNHRGEGRRGKEHGAVVRAVWIALSELMSGPFRCAVWQKRWRSWDTG
jgi:hypothetical protein